jgi:hypothetical protein
LSLAKELAMPQDQDHGDRLTTGPYAHQPLTNLPSHYIAAIMGESAEEKWSRLTPKQQEGLKAERDRRAAGLPNPPSRGEVEPAPEAAPPTALDPAETEPEPAPTPGPEPEPEPELVLAPVPAIDTFDTDDILKGTVADVTDRLTTITSTDDLDALDQAEAEGKDRVGVHEAIEHRRSELEAGV